MVTLKCVSLLSETNVTWRSSNLFSYILVEKFLTKKEQSSPKTMILYSCKYLQKLHTKLKMHSKKMLNFFLTKSKRVPSILKTILLESRLETQSKKLKRKYFHHKLSNLNLKRKDVADLLNRLSLMMFYKFLLNT
mgnify:CR=1 FL=1